MQTLKIECQKCGTTETLIFDGCLVLGINLDGTLKFIEHEINPYELGKLVGKSFSVEDFFKGLHAALHQYEAE